MLDLDAFAKGSDDEEEEENETKAEEQPPNIEDSKRETSGTIISVTSMDNVEMMPMNQEEDPKRHVSDKNLSVNKTSATSSFYNSWTNPDNSLFRHDRYEATINMKKRNVVSEFESLDRLLSQKGEEQAKLQRMETKIAMGMDMEEAAKEEPEKPKIGTWDGVFASCILNIFGVIMFLRLPWVVGQVGIWMGCGIILLSGVVVTLTTLSMSAICTSGRVFEGGAYYLISRSLGPEIGAAVGILFSIGLSVAVSMYVIGFCETLVDNLGAVITGNDLNDIRIWGFILVTICLGMVLFGIGWIIKLQLGLLAFLIIVILSFFVGCFTEEDAAKGVVKFGDGLSSNFGENSGPADGGEDFFIVFGVFFPAVTGIMAGANISGDLENPAENIPKGTLYAVGISIATYLIMAIFIGIVGDRTPPGNSGDDGLIDNFLIMANMSVFGPLIYGGVYAATFTSALASLVGAPRVLYKVASDNILPISYFAKLDGGGNPVRGYFVAYGIACCCIAIGELNAIAPLITQFFMITYALINYSCFMLEIYKSPGWRPSFIYFNKWTAILGAIMCVVIMFLTDYISALVACSIAIGIYKYVQHADIDINWGTAMQSRSHVNALTALLKLRKDKSHIKNFRPNILVHVGAPDDRKHLLYFGQTLREFQSMVVYCNISIGDYRQNINEYRASHQDGYIQSGVTMGRNGQPLPETPKVKGLFNSVLAGDFRTGNHMALQLCGLGALKANTMMMGYKEEWYNSDRKQKSDKPKRIERKPSQDEEMVAELLRDDTQNHGNDTLRADAGGELIRDDTKYNTIHLADKFRAKDGSTIRFEGDTLREDALQEIELQKEMEELEKKRSDLRESLKKEPKKKPSPSNDEYVGMISDTLAMGMGVMICRHMENINWQEPTMYPKPNSVDVERGIETIDVWWLMDDGGLSILIPHMMSQHKFWRYHGTHIRMLIPCTLADIPNVKKLADTFTKDLHLDIHVEPVDIGEGENMESPMGQTVRIEMNKIHDVKNHSRKKVTERWMRIAEMVREYSRNAHMCFITLPNPDDKVSAEEYMSRIELVSNIPRTMVRANPDYVPTVLIRGAAKELYLTYYLE